VELKIVESNWMCDARRSASVFGDALRRLAAASTYLYQDGGRYWYSTQPTVTKIADDRAEQLKRNPDALLRKWTASASGPAKNGDFLRVHPLPNQDKMFPMTWTHVSSCWTSTIPTAKTQTPRPGDG